MSEEAAARAANEELNQSVRFADLEQKYVDLQKDRQVWFDKAKAGDDRLESFESEKETLQATILELRSTLSTAKTDLSLEKDKTGAVASESKSQQERSSRLEAEADNLREEISRLTESKKELQNQASEWETKAKLNDSAAVPLTYALERANKELDTLSSHKKWVDEELSNRSQELSKCKTAHSEQMQMLRQELDQAVMDRDESVAAENRLALSKKGLETKVEQLSRELRDSKHDAATATETAERELQAERKVIALQSEQLERVKSQCHRLERELEGLREIARKASQGTDQELDKLRTEIELECRKVLEEQEAVFKDEIERLKSQLSTTEAAPFASPLKNRPLLTLGDETISLTDVYSKLNQTEDALKKSRAECKQKEAYIQSIEADIARKSPLMLRQRKEYEEAMESLDDMRNRLRESIQEAKLHKEDAAELRDEMGRLQRRNNDLKGESKTLAEQVRALLTSKAGGEVPAGVPTSVAEILEQNQMLMGEHRRLSSQIEEMQIKLQDDVKSSRLEKAEQELETLYDQQKKQEAFVTQIVHQRDLYRALVSNQEGAAVDLSSTELVVAQHSQDTRAAEERCKTLEQDLAKAKADLTIMKGDKDAMLERVDRNKVYINDLTVSIEKFQHELSKANATAARSDSDAQYYREKCTRAEINVEQSRDSLQHIQETKQELHSLNSQLHQQVATAKATAEKCESDVRQAEMKLRLAETQAATAQAAEARLAEEARQLRTELTRQGSLVGSVQKIEASLSAKSDEDKANLKEQVDRLTDQLEQARSKQGVESENVASRVKELELELKEAEKKKADAMKESIAAKEETLVATTERQKLVAKAARLESELSSAMKKLGTTSADPEEVALQTKVETLTQQLEEAKTEITSLNERVKNFEGVAKASEQELISLTEASTAFKKGKITEIEELTKRISDIKEEGKKKDEILAKFTADLFAQRGEQEKSEGVLKEKLAGMEGQVKTAKKDADAAVARATALATEMEKYQTDASTAQSNYERELDLHASANKDLRVAREEIATEQRLRRAAEDKLESVKVEISAQEKQLHQEKEKIDGDMKELQETLKQSREQNDLLLSQVSTLGDEIEKAQSERLEVASGEDASAGEGDTLRKIVSELREVVKFLRSEREILEAKLDAARRTAEREKAASAVTKRSLDEARSELTILQASAPSDNSASDTQMAEKLKNGEAQLTLLRDSNKMLRDESVKLQEQLATTTAKLAAEKKNSAPLEQKQRNLSVENAALVAEKQSLQREVDSWKDRVGNLLSKLNQIDPEEHDKVVKEAAALKKSCSDLKAQKAAADKEGTDTKTLLTKANKDLTQQKALNQKQQSLLRKLTVDKETASKSSTATATVTKERDVLKESLRKKEIELTSTKVEVQGANTRIENLKNRLRQFQKTISEQRKKLVDMESSSIAAPPPAPSAEAKAPSQAAAPTPAAPIPSAQRASETTKQSDAVQEKSTIVKESPKSAEATTEKVAVKTTPSPKAGLPNVPAGGFKFGPSSTQAAKAPPTASGSTQPAPGPKVTEKKTEANAPPKSTSPTKANSAPTTSSAPPAKKAKVSEQKEQPAKKETPSAPEQDESDKMKAALVLKNKLKALTQRKQDAEMAIKKRNQDAETLKEKLRKRKLDKSQADQQAQKRAAVEAEEQKQVAVKAQQIVAKKTEQPNTEPKAPVETKKPEDPIVVAKKPEVSVVGTKKSTAPKENTESKDVTAKPSGFGAAPFGGSTFGSGTATFGATSFGKPATTPTTTGFGKATAAPTVTGFGKPATTPTSTGFGKPASGATTTGFGKPATETGFGKPATETGFGKPATETGFGKPATAPSTGFGTPAGGGIVFGQSSSIGGFGAAAPAKRDTSTPSASSTFLDMKPPSSSAAPFSFGSSTIKLPTPNVAPPPAGPSPFGAFTGNPFGGGAPAPSAQPLFGSSASIKRSAPDESADESDSKQARVEEGKEAPKDGE